MMYQVSDNDLQEVPGCTPLKIFIVLNNHPSGMTATELARTLGMNKRTVYLALTKMQESSQVVKNSSLFCRNLHKNEENFKEKEKNQKKNKIINFKKEEEEARPRELIDDLDGVPPSTGSLLGSSPDCQFGQSSPPKASLLGSSPDYQFGHSSPPEASLLGSSPDWLSGLLPRAATPSPFSSLLDNPTQLEALLMTCHLPPQPDLQAFFRPFAERFKTDLEACGEDLYLIDPKNLKYRFKYWFTKHYRDNDNKTANNRSEVDPSTVVQDAIIDWDELQRTIDEQERQRQTQGTH